MLGRGPNERLQDVDGGIPVHDNTVTKRMSAFDHGRRFQKGQSPAGYPRASGTEIDRNKWFSKRLRQKIHGRLLLSCGLRITRR